MEKSDYEHHWVRNHDRINVLLYNHIMGYMPRPVLRIERNIHMTSAPGLHQIQTMEFTCEKCGLEGNANNNNSIVVKGTTLCKKCYENMLKYMPKVNNGNEWARMQINCLEDEAFKATNIEIQEGFHYALLQTDPPEKGVESFYVYLFNPEANVWIYRGQLQFSPPPMSRGEHFLDVIGRDKWRIVEEYDGISDCMVVVVSIDKK